ncbi:MAG TPA: protein-methionine-sulfoxide reductase heme-binding subunit MsrQ [Stellaceae bacterium]|nr:protein-methionine-sulfoxide reductase heme-binding subunit MsrQ [Stellaceae bacterium]
MFPWQDYGGRFSPLRTTVFALLFMPALWVLYLFATNDLGSRPLTEAIHDFGLWTIRFIFLALVISPARRLLNWPQLIEVRRMLGVTAAAYVLVHFCLYVADESFNLATVASEIVRRIYLTIGFVTLCGLAVLAATSTDGMVKRMGGRNWQRLHRIVYAIGVLAIIHFFMQSKLDEWEPIWMAGFYVWLMGWRGLDWLAPRGRTAPLWQVVVLGLVAAAATGIGEAGYYALFMHAPFQRVLAANFSLAIGVRPSWIVLAAACVMTLAGTARRRRRVSGPRAPSPERSRASAARGA